jgi:hypothetical protein
LSVAPDSTKIFTPDKLISALPLPIFNVDPERTIIVPPLNPKVPVLVNDTVELLVTSKVPPVIVSNALEALEL